MTLLRWTSQDRIGALGAGIRVNTPVAEGAVTSFLPTDISGLLWWWDFSDANSLFQDDAGTIPVTTDGDPIGKVNDKSGNGKHLTQSTPTKKPTFKTNIVNGKSIARGDGGDVLAGTLSTNYDAKTIFVVMTPGNTVKAYVLTLQNAGYSSIIINYIANTMEYYGSTPRISMGSVVMGTFALHELVYDGTNATTYKNGTQVTNGSGNDDALNYIRLFATNNIPNNGLVGDIGELFVYNSALGSTDRQSVESYIRTKWGTP